MVPLEPDVPGVSLIIWKRCQLSKKLPGKDGCIANPLSYITKWLYLHILPYCFSSRSSHRSDAKCHIGTVLYMYRYNFISVFHIVFIIYSLTGKRMEVKLIYSIWPYICWPFCPSHILSSTWNLHKLAQQMAWPSPWSLCPSATYAKLYNLCPKLYCLLE